MRKESRAVSAALALAMLLSLLPALPPVYALSGTASYKPAESNIAVKYWVSATASSNADDAGLAIDGDPATSWIAAGAPATLTVDLSGAYDALRKAEVVFAGAASAYKYSLEGSADGTDWFLLADRTANAKVAQGFTDVFSHAGIRYMRLTITGGDPVGVAEFRIINYLRANMKNGSDMSELGSANTTQYYYNLNNDPPQPGVRGGALTGTGAGTAEEGNNIFGLVKDCGWSVNRLRIWNSPTSSAATNCSPENTARLAKYVVGSGLELAIDFHYADTWADPQSQPKPVAWQNLMFDDLVTSTHDFTYKTISDLVEQGTAPTIVALGNEITSGMMWGKEWNNILGARTNNSAANQPDFGGGVLWRYWHEDEVTPEEYKQYTDSLQRLARLVDAGIKAIREVEAKYGVKIDTEMHCAFNVVEGNVNTPIPDRDKFPKVMEFISQMSTRLAGLGSKLDRIGVSYYPDWHGSWIELQRNLVEISKLLPGTKLNISESSPRNSGTTPTDPNRPSGFQASVQSQGDDLATIMTILNDVPNNVGQGVWTWGGTGSFQYGPVNFTTTGTSRQPYASIKVYKDAFATGVVESGVYATTAKGAAPALPATVKELNVATGQTSDVAVAWDAVDPASYAAPGTFTVKGVAAAAGNMDEVTAYVTVVDSLESRAASYKISVDKVDGIGDGWMNGADVSSILSLEEGGAKFYDKLGREADPFVVMAEAGINWVRFRIWNDPWNAAGKGYGGGNCDVPRTAIMAKRATDAGLRVSLDFHNSDFWADPGKQMVPKAWANMDIDQLEQALYAFTKQSVQYIIAAGADVGMVQIGNETNSRMTGQTGANMRRLFKAGSKAVREVDPNILVAIHISDPQNGNHENFADQLAADNVDYDVFGSSYYPNWHGSYTNFTAIMKRIADKHNKLVACFETASIYTTASGDGGGNTNFDPAAWMRTLYGWPSSGNAFISLQTQATILRDVAKACADIGDKCLGWFYWEPAWIPVGPPPATNNRANWEEYGTGWAASYAGEYDPNDAGRYYGGPSTTNRVLFDFAGRPLPTLDIFNLIKTGSYEVSIASVADIDHVTTAKGFELPTYTDALFSDGEVRQIHVDWMPSQVAAAKAGGPGTYQISGQAGAYNYEWRNTSTNAAVGVIAGTDLKLNLTVLEDEPTYVAVPDEVARIDFNEGWQFLLATRTPTDATGGFATNGFADPAGMPTTAQIIDPAFDDSAWRTVKVPHDFSIEGPKVSSGSSGSQDYLQGGLGWYRKSFVVPESMKDAKRVQLDFEGVYQNSNVYVNGQLVGNYPSGYTGFTYDITDYLTYGDDAPNVVVVKVQNKSPSGRWYTGSGITRPVTLVVSGQTRYLRNGVVLTMPTVEADYKADGSAELKVRAEVRSDDTNSNIWIVSKVYNADGTLKTQHTSEPQPMNPSSFISLDDAFKVSGVSLWTLEDPYRYTVVTELYYLRDGSTEPAELVDSATNKIGFRWFKIDTNEGAYLNDKYLKFQGVDLHHDDGALGAAGTYDAVKRKMEILKTMGVNAYRTSHNPPNKAIIDVCSELGIVVMEEAYDGWGGAKGGSDFGLFWWLNVPSEWKGSLRAVPANTTWSEWVIKEMVARDINEPSVVMWSIGNEVGGLGTRPSWYNWADFRRAGDPNPSDYTATSLTMFTEAMRLRNYCKDVDPTRYVVMGDDSLRTPPTTNSLWGYVTLALDGIGLNYNTAASVDALHNTYPGRFLFESESSSQTGTRGVYFDAPMQNTPANQTPGSRGVSSFDNNFSSWTMPNEYGLKKDRDRKFFLGQFIWSGFDYLGEPTPYGVYPMGHSNFGCIDTAGFPKDSYYLYRSQWLNTEHTTHLAPMNWTDWALGENVEVWVNTDGYSAELFLNGESLGSKNFDEKTTTYGKTYYETTELTKDARGSGYGLANERSTQNPDGYTSPNGSHGKLHLTWNVPFTPGELKTVTKDKAGNIIGEDVLRTAGHAYTTNVTPYKSVVKADGKSLAYFTVDVVDANGTMLPSAKNILEFSVTNGMIIGVDTGWPGITDLYKYGNVDRSPVSRVHAWNGKALVIVEASKDPGLVTLRTTSEDLVPTTCSVLSTADGKGDYASATVQESLGSAVSAALYGGNALTVPTGYAATLPVDAEVTYASGAKVLKKVTWPAVQSSQFAAPGTFNVTGTVADTSLSVTANVTVASAARTNVALNTTAGAQDFELTPTSGPLATATFTAGTNYPNYMLNGNTTTNWNNRGNGSGTVVLGAVTYSKPYEFLQVYWNGYKSISEVDLYFTLGSSGPSNNLPGSINVQYWDGFAWVDAANQKTTLAAVSNEASSVTFDPVLTSKVRAMIKNATPYSAATGSFTVVKFEVYNLSEDVEPAVIVSLADAQVTTQAGVAPQLPATVVATFDDGGTAAVQVAWDAVAPSSYAQEGTFTVEGTVAGTAIRAKVVVTVTAAPPPPPPGAFINKSFEDGADPWKVGPPESALSNTSGNYIRKNESQNARPGGTYAVNYYVSGAPSGDTELYQNILVDGPGVYTLSAWVQGSTSGTGILELFAEANGVSYTMPFAVTGWNQWINPSLAGIAITNTARVGIRTTYANGSWTWIDDFDLVKTASLGPVVGIAAPAELNTDLGSSLKYSLAISDVADANLFEVSAKFDAGKLEYVGTTIDLPATLSPAFLKGPAFDPDTGEYTATVALLLQQAMLTVGSDPAPFLTIEFAAKPDAKNGDVVDAALGAAKVYVMEAEFVTVALDATLDPATASTIVTNRLRWDIDGNGALDMLDISVIIRNYYLAAEGDANWAGAKAFDANGDGIIDLADILIICSWFDE